MKITTEIAEGAEDEIIIRCSEVDNRIRRLQLALNEALSEKSEMRLTLGEAEIFVPYGEILFFETTDRCVAAHTADGMYYTDMRLFELENLLPSFFIRASKSCIVNVRQIRSVSRTLSGNGEITFTGCKCKTFFSRLYYKPLITRIKEIRL